MPVATLIQKAWEFNNVNVTYPVPVGLGAREQSQADLIDS